MYDYVNWTLQPNSYGFSHVGRVDVNQVKKEYKQGLKSIHGKTSS